MTALAVCVMAACGQVAENLPLDTEDRPAVAPEVNEPSPPDVAIEHSPRLWLVYAVQLHKQGFYREARDIGATAIQVIRNNGLVNLRSVPIYFVRQAEFEEDMYQFREARKWLLAAIFHDSKHDSVSDREMLMVVNNLAGVLNSNGDGEIARTIHQEGRLSGELAGLTPGERAGVHVNRASVLLDFEQYDAAREALDKAEAVLRENSVREDHPCVPSLLVIKGRLEQKTGRNGKAKTSLLAAADTNERIHGSHTLPFILSVLNLAELHIAEGNTDAAASVLLRIKIIDEDRQFGPRHPVMERLRAAQTACRPE